MFGVDYQTYFCVAILKHLNLENDLNNINQKIIQHHTYKDLQIYLKVKMGLFLTKNTVGILSTSLSIPRFCRRFVEKKNVET